MAGATTGGERLLIFHSKLWFNEIDYFARLDSLKNNKLVVINHLPLEGKKMKHARIIPALAITMLLSSAAYAELKIINSFQCAEKIPAAKEIMNETEKLQKTVAADLGQLQEKGQKLAAEIQKDRTDLMSKSALMSQDEKLKSEKKINDKNRKLEEMQADAQRMVQNAQAEMQMVQMRLEPFVVEVIQNAQEVASKNPAIDAVWDEATKQFIYKKPSTDLNSEVVKLTEKKTAEGKTTVAKNKPAAAPKAPAKVA